MKTKYLKLPCPVPNCEKLRDERAERCASHAMMKKHNPDFTDEQLAERTAWLANPICPVPGCTTVLKSANPDGILCLKHSQVRRRNPDYSLQEIADHITRPPAQNVVRPSRVRDLSGNPVCIVPRCENLSTTKGPICGRHAILQGFHPEFTLQDLADFVPQKEIGKQNIAKKEAFLAEQATRGVKTCSRCERELPYDQFHKSSYVSSGLRSHCKDCDNEMVLENYHNKLKFDPSFKVRKAVSAGVRSALRATNSTKNGGSCFDYLPYTVEQLRNHLESQFTPEMNWNNYGSYWSIDHRKPQAMFDYTSMDSPEFRMCWALDNLQPLTVEENTLKNSVWEGKKYYRNDTSSSPVNQE